MAFKAYIGVGVRLTLERKELIPFPGLACETAGTGEGDLHLKAMLMKPGLHFKDARGWWRSFRQIHGYLRAVPKKPFRHWGAIILIAYCLGMFGLMVFILISCGYL